MLGVWRLQLLREVARRGTIKGAAAAMAVTPSAVSQQLKQLETEAGTQLLEPYGRMVRLTDAGEILVRYADTITAAIAAAEAELAASREETSGSLRVAAFPTAARAILPKAFADLGASHPRLRLTLRDLETKESLRALALDDVDVAVVDEYDEASQVREKGIVTVPILHDPLHLVLPPGRDHTSSHALANLGDEQWVMDIETSTIFQVAVRACRQAGFEPYVRSNCKDYEVILALVAAGLGVALVPGLALHDRPAASEVEVVAVEPPLRRVVSVAFRPERRNHPNVAAFVAELERFGREFEQSVAVATKLRRPARGPVRAVDAPAGLRPIHK